MKVTVLKKANFSNIDKYSYNDRVVSDEWIDFISKIANPRGKTIMDIGCGGGLYTLALATLDPKKVLGIDSSEEMIKKGLSKLQISKYKNVDFKVGNACHLYVGVRSYDIIIERALVHHLSKDDFSKNLAECHRVLSNRGLLIIQDRTFEDCLDKSPNNLRRFFYSRYPDLLKIEKERRFSTVDLKNFLNKSGFNDIHHYQIREKRKKFNKFVDIKDDILTRRGRTILQYLNDNELLKIADDIQNYFISNKLKSFEEEEPWTIITGTV